MQACFGKAKWFPLWFAVLVLFIFMQFFPGASIARGIESEPDPDPVQADPAAASSSNGPIIEVFTINHDQLVTTLHEVSLQLKVSGQTGDPDEALEARFSNDEVTWSPWEPCPRERDWLLAGGAGTRFVYVGCGTLKGASPGSSAIEVYLPVMELTLEPAELTLTAGDPPAVLTVEISPADATYKHIQWSSSNEAVAIVEDGTVTPVAAGQAVITATAEGGASASCTVVVKPSLTIFEEPPSCPYGDLDGDGRQCGDVKAAPGLSCRPR